MSPYDENGCCISCGYTWCDVLKSCIRLWETPCISHRRLTQLEDFNISEMGIFIGVCGSAIVGILVATQKSKCESVCWGMCKRRVDLVIEEEKLQLENQNQTIPETSA